MVGVAVTVTVEPHATVPPPLVAPPPGGDELVLMVLLTELKLATKLRSLFALTVQLRLLPMTTPFSVQLTRP